MPNEELSYVIVSLLVFFVLGFIGYKLFPYVQDRFAAVAINVHRIKQNAHQMPPEIAKLVEDNSVMLEQVRKEISTISHLLHPPLLDVAGLDSALRWYVDGFSDRSGIEVDLQIPKPFPRLRNDIELAVFRMVQECLGNIRRHSGSKSCAVRLITTGDKLRVEVEDWGEGIPEEKQSTFPQSAGVGLRGLHERMHQLGGTMEIKSSERGTTVIAVLAAAYEMPAA